MLQSVITKERGASRLLEFAMIEGCTITRTQIEMRNGRIYMRSKRRSFVFS